MGHFDIEREGRIKTFVCLPNHAAGFDYIAMDFELSFLPSSLSRAFLCRRLTFIDDSIAELNETLTVELVESSCPQITQNEVIVTIISKPRLLQ